MSAHYMEKDFDRWNKLKKAINASEESARVYFHEGDIWWVHLGVNANDLIPAYGDARKSLAGRDR